MLFGSGLQGLKIGKYFKNCYFRTLLFLMYPKMLILRPLIKENDIQSIIYPNRNCFNSWQL